MLRIRDVASSVVVVRPVLPHASHHPVITHPQNQGQTQAQAPRLA